MDNDNRSAPQQKADITGFGNESGNQAAPTEPVRSRWTPKPEQILILESIFNSGMVNPPKDETVRIRKLLEKFGSVGDANVFYWFQNRRSRSRRRQRQMQANMASASYSGGASSVFHEHPPPPLATVSCCSSISAPGYASSTSVNTTSSSPSSSFSWGEGAEDLFSISQQMGFEENRVSSQCMDSYGSGSIGVFINGMACEVPSGPIDVRSSFGHDAVVVHSSGEVLQLNEYGILLQGLQMGESYYLVARPY
ncbi:hypothetical protein HPP92_014366 [Vanilla planifolia]|uniref:Homeobox domain-containing protein n=1 Tax=Vanilla planifolia TaxID=51239 RepID=A0A835QWJ5_VANPL|nr:hypothetical protein HPP92_014366 [Vanilla planifolia]